MAARIPKRRHPAASLAGNEAPLLLRLVYRIVPKHVANTILPPNASLTRQVWAPEVFFCRNACGNRVFCQRCLHTRIIALHACAKKNILNSSTRTTQLHKHSHTQYTQNTHTHTTLLRPRALHLCFILSAKRRFCFCFC